MEQPTKEQMKKFWEHFGFKHHTYPEHWTLNHVSIEGARWITPDKCGAIIDLPKIEPTNLFQYAIPKLQNEGYHINIQCHEHKGFKVLVLDVVHNTWKESICEDDDLSLALFGAINQVIK